MFFRSSGGAFLSGGATDLSAATVVSGIGGGGAFSEGFSAAGFFGDEVWALRASADANATVMKSRRFIRFGPPCVALPNIYPLSRGPNHRRTVGNIERLLELVEVRQRNDRPIFARRMRIGIQLQLEIFVTLIAPPNLSVTQE